MFRNILDPNGIYNLNIYCGNSLENNLDKYIKNEWKVDKFDIIVGNPPYNAFGGTATGNTIWQNFVKKFLGNYLVDKGYLLFVHPNGLLIYIFFPFPEPIEEASYLQPLFVLYLK